MVILHRMAGIYIHIPFCKRKCIYCDFYSVGLSDAVSDRYRRALIREFCNRKSELHGERIDTLYIGGGTPSLLSAGWLLSVVEPICDPSCLQEFTIEVNPDDVTEKYVAGLSGIGCNRISMGVQSFVDDELAFLGRRHDSKKAVDAIAILKESPIDNVSIDLIYGIPGQTLVSWEYSVDRAIATGVDHISAYNLTYEDGTRLTKMLNRGDCVEAEDDLCVKMFDLLVEKLSAAGFRQYEISNFARNGMYSKHNSSYWNFTPYLGLGASAHSFDGEKRRYNPSSLKRYCECVFEKGVACEVEQETKSQLYNEWVMTRLRTMWGLDTDDLKVRFGSEYYDYAMLVLNENAEKGYVILSDGVARLTQRGIMMSDGIFRGLFIV